MYKRTSRIIDTENYRKYSKYKMKNYQYLTVHIGTFSLFYVYLKKVVTLLFNLVLS